MRLSAGLILPASLALIVAVAAPAGSVDVGLGGISGTVTSATTGLAVDGIHVTAVSPSGLGSSDTAEDGTYTIADLSAGEYVVYFEKFRGAFATERYNDAHGNYYGTETPEPVTVVSGVDTPVIDAALEPGGTITGTVRSGINGQPVPDARACAIESDGDIQSCALTNSVGTYWLSGLLVGNYRVQFLSPSTDLRDEYYPNAHLLANATPVSVAEWQETTNIDAYLDRAPVPGRGSISGIVTSAATGLPVLNVAVHAYSLGTPANSRFDVTEADGTYRVEDLVADEYVVMFDQYLGAYATERYNNAHGWYSVPEPATPVIITEGENETGIDAVLEPGGTISGYVTSGITGLPVANPQVCTVDSEGNTLVCAQTNSGSPGFYWLSGVPVGTSLVHFVSPSPDLLDEYYLNAHALAGATPVAVTQGNETTSIDAVLDRVGSDVTPPEISLWRRSPSANLNGWNNSDVRVDWSCTDDESDPTWWTVSAMADDEGADQSVRGTCIDDAGNTSAATETGINIDRTPPAMTVLSRAPAANPDGWNRESVSVTWTCEDTLSGVIAPTVTDTVVTDGTNQSAEGTCTDRADNESTRTLDGISIDRTPPTVTWTGPIDDGARYLYGTVPAAPTCTSVDGLSGPKDCSVDGYSTAVGMHVLTATARDRALNSSAESRSYEVLSWTLRGFRSPVDMDGWNVVQAGSNLPLKFQVFQAALELTSTSVVSSFGAVPVTCPNGTPSADLVPGTGFSALRYDAKAGFFSLDWKAPKSPGACVAVSVTTLDGSALTAQVVIK